MQTTELCCHVFQEPESQPRYSSVVGWLPAMYEILTSIHSTAQGCVARETDRGTERETDRKRERQREIDGEKQREAEREREMEERERDSSFISTSSDFYLRMKNLLCVCVMYILGIHGD